MKFGVSAITNSYDGMSVHHATVARILGRLGSVTLIPDGVHVSTTEMDQYDFVFRYGWSEQVSWGYNDADFDYNLASDPAKNVLVAPFCMKMLNTRAIEQIKARFGRIVYDSSLSKEHGSHILKSVRSVFIHPTLGVDMRKPSMLTNGMDEPYTYLHISNGLYWIKGVDIVVDAFIREFSPSDGVKLCLVIKDQESMFDKIRYRFARQGRAHQLELFENKLPQSHLAKLYEQADCYVCVSRYDTFSLPTLEAAVYGLQVIAHDKCGMRDYIQRLDLDQYIPVSTQEVMVPEGAWRENMPITFWEPNLRSAENALRAAYVKGRLPKYINQRLLDDFGNEDKGIRTMQEILA